MSAKDDYSNNKAKDFFILHGEKVAFGVCLLLVAVFVLLGRGVGSLEPNKTPTVLSSRVAAAKQHMNRLDKEFWEEQIEDAREPNFNLEEIVIEGRKTIDYTNYYSYLYLPAREPQALRQDPDLLPPTKPLLTAMNAALALASGESPLDELDYAVVEKEEEELPKRSTRSSTRNFNEGYDGGYSPESDEEASFVESEPKEYRQVTASIVRRLPGFKLSQQEGVPKAYTIVAGTATVPIKDQWLEFKNTFENAIGFDPMRDRPIYMWYEVQRQDVTDRPDGSIDPDAWKAIMFTGGYDQWYRERFQPPPPIVDLAYYEGTTGRRHDYSLTSPIPIILLRDIEDFALHPDTPKRRPPSKEVSEESPETEDEDDPSSEPRIGPSPLVPSPTDPVRDSEGYTGYDSGVESEYGATEEELAAFDPETGPPAPLKLVRFFDLKANPGRQYRYRVRVALVDPNNPLDPQAVASGGEESGSSGYSTSGSSESYSTTDSSSATVSPRWLSKEVRERIEGIQKADIEKHGARFVEWRYTDWSAPSDVVAVSEDSEEILAGSVTAPKERRIDENVSFETEEPTGEVVVSEWDANYAVEVPAKRKVSLGTVLNFESDADVLHPIKYQIKRIPSYSFTTNSIVLDMRGGNELPGSNKEDTISVPGEVLVVDGDGRLHARNELDDMDEYRLKLLMPDEEELPEPEVYEEETSSEEEEGYFPRTRRRRSRGDDA